ncbi:MAG: hypothetical protein ACYDHT_07605 [Solirubrobacteraceae bacterium]
MTTEPRSALAAPAQRRGRGLLVAWTATVFLALLALLAVRVGTGQDPALRARAAATPPPVRRVLVRRVIERRVIVHLPPSAAPRASSSQLLSSGAATFAATTTTRTS